jgi:hypothetical protein
MIFTKVGIAVRNRIFSAALTTSGVEDLCFTATTIFENYYLSKQRKQPTPLTYPE